MKNEEKDSPSFKGVKLKDKPVTDNKASRHTSRSSKTKELAGSPNFEKFEDNEYEKDYEEDDFEDDENFESGIEEEEDRESEMDKNFYTGKKKEGK